MSEVQEDSKKPEVEENVKKSEVEEDSKKPEDSQKPEADSNQVQNSDNNDANDESNNAEDSKQIEPNLQPKLSIVKVSKVSIEDDESVPPAEPEIKSPAAPDDMNKNSENAKPDAEKVNNEGLNGSQPAEPQNKENQPSEKNADANASKPPSKAEPKCENVNVDEVKENMSESEYEEIEDPNFNVFHSDNSTERKRIIKVKYKSGAQGYIK